MSQAQATNLSLGAAVQAYYCYSNNTLEDIMLLALPSLFSPFILLHGKSSSPEDLLSMYKFGLNVYNYPSKKNKGRAFEVANLVQKQGSHGNVTLAETLHDIGLLILVEVLLFVLEIRG